MTVIVDYGRGNLFSLRQALSHVGVEAEFADSPEKILAAERVILPGVGAFRDGMMGLEARGLVGPLKEVARRGTPLLGICLGMQLLATRSEEFGEHDGLDLIPAIVRRLPDGDGSSSAIRIPNIGWRALRPAGSPRLMKGLGERPMVYFVHSYALEDIAAADLTATIAVNGRDAPAIVCRGNLLGMQFHPEKSASVGLELLRRFLSPPDRW